MNKISTKLFIFLGCVAVSSDNEDGLVVVANCYNCPLRSGDCASGDETKSIKIVKYEKITSVPNVEDYNAIKNIESEFDKTQSHLVETSINKADIIQQQNIDVKLEFINTEPDEAKTTGTGILGGFGVFAAAIVGFRRRILKFFTRQNEKIPKSVQRTRSPVENKLTAKTVFSVIAASMIDMIFGIVLFTGMAVKDDYAKMLKIPTAEFNNTCFWITFIGGLVSLIIFYLADFKFKPSFTSSAIFYGIGTIVFALSANPNLSLSMAKFGVYFGRFMIGIASGVNFAYIPKYISSISPPEWLSVLMNGASLGFPVGMLVYFSGYSTFNEHFHTASWIIAVLCMLLAILFHWIETPNNTEPEFNRNDQKISKKEGFYKLISKKNRKKFIIVLIMLFLCNIDGINFVFFQPDVVFPADSMPLDVCYSIIIGLVLSFGSSFIIKRWGFRLPLAVSMIGVGLFNVAFLFEYQMRFTGLLFFAFHTSGIIICSFYLLSKFFAGPLLEHATFWAMLVSRISCILSVFLLPNPTLWGPIFITYIIILAISALVVFVFCRKSIDYINVPVIKEDINNSGNEDDIAVVVAPNRIIPNGPTSHIINLF